MKKIFIKYRNAIVGVTLCGYLLTFFLNVVHFHTFELNGAPAIEARNESKLQALTSNSDFACVVHQNFTSLHTLTILKPHGFDFIYKAQPVKLSGTSHSHINKLFYCANHLRAPPFFS